MRVGILLESSSDAVNTAWTADRLGLDLVALEHKPDHDGLVAAAGLAGATTWSTVVAQVDAGGTTHPVHVAERIAVADQALGGRLLVVLRCADGTSDAAGVLAETVEVLDKALSGRPFRHEGPRWRIPAELPENDTASRSAVRMTPPPSQWGMRTWLAGPGAGSVGIEVGRPVLLEGDGALVDASGWWAEIDERWGPVGRRMERPAVVELSDLVISGEQPAGPGVDGAVERLLDHQARWGLDTVLVRVPSVDTHVLRVLAALRARLQLHDIPEGLDRFWAETVPRREATPPR